VKPSSDQLDTQIQLPAIKGVGDLVSQTFKLFFSHLRWVLFLSLFYIPFLLAKNTWFLFNTPSSKLIKAGIDSSIIGLVVLFTAPALVYILVRSLREGKAPRATESLQWGWNCFSRNFVNHFKSGLLIIGGFILLVVPGIIALLWYSFLSVVVSVEGSEQTDPMNRSKNLAKEHMGTLLGAGALMTIFNLLVCAAGGVFIGVIVGVLKALNHDTTPFVMTDHLFMSTFIEWITVILNMDLGIMALCGYLSWSPLSPKEVLPVEAPAPSVSIPAVTISEPPRPAPRARKTAPKSKTKAKKPAPKIRRPKK
jgi:hypothetical protein